MTSAVAVSNPMTVVSDAMTDSTRIRILAAGAALTLAVGGAAWSGCDTDSADEQVDKATDQINKATEKAQKQLDEADSSVNEATEKAQKKLDKAQEKINENLP